MKKLLILTLVLSQQLNAYNIYVMNDTVNPVKVEISTVQGGCHLTNGGDTLPAKTEDHWGANDMCTSRTTFTYPDGTTGQVDTWLTSRHHFVITSRVAKDRYGNPIKDSNGEDKIIYNWEDR